MNKITSKQPVNPDPSATISFQQPFQDASELDVSVRQAARNMIQQAGLPDLKHIIERGGYRESLDGLASDSVGDGQNPKRR